MAEQRNFIEQAIDADIAAGRWGPAGDGSVVRTRFPPEPNGYLHIGHAKSICLNFGLAEQFGGACNLRFDDTNPTTEDVEYVRSIVNDVRWLGFRWPGARADDPMAGVLFASDLFERMYEYAEDLAGKGLAYVDDQSAEEIRQTRGTPTVPGTRSAGAARSPAENLDLLRRMRAGEFPDGSRVLRARIDMASPNFNLRDPVMYRIVHAHHHRTGDAWCLYPMYDWAHGLEDSAEGITHSICTLEFEDHRPLYDWFIDAINRGRPTPIHHPRQIEFSRLNPTFLITSKRRLKQLVEEGHVRGWDDPRMPTISGHRRRGYTPEAIRAFCKAVGTTKFKGLHDIALLENALRDDLNRRAPRRMAVLRPLKVTITNWGEHGGADRLEVLDAVNNPEVPAAGTRPVRFGRQVWIERDDFMVDPPGKFFRLAPGREVRLRYAYWITCHDHATDADGTVVEVFCTYDPQTRGGDSPPPAPDGSVRKVKGTLHWVEGSAPAAEVRLVDRLFTQPEPGKRTGNALDDLNPASMEVLTGCRVEPSLLERLGDEPAWSDGIRRFQFERLGYFAVDPDASPRLLVLNRAVTLKDSWKGG